jgi:predicted Zn-dependent protease
MVWPFGEGPIGVWLERRRAFRDLKHVLYLEDATISLRDDNPLHRAKVLVEVDDNKHAREFLELARARIPNYVLTCPDTIEIMLRLGDFDELESFTLKGAKLFPKKPHYLEGYALAAERQRHFDEAVRRWAVVRKKFPNERLAYVCAVGCLRQLGRLDEAEDLLRSAMRQVPGDLPLQFEYGRVAEARGDWAEAYRRWDSIRDRHPSGFVGAAQALQKLGRTEDAEALLAEGRFRYPTFQTIAFMQALIAEQRGDIDEALKRWTVARARFPLETAGYRDAIRLLSGRQEWAEADEIALAAIDRFHDHAWPLEDYANLAHGRKDWAEAAKRWAALRAAYPDHKVAPQQEAAALAAAGLQPAGAADSATSPPPCSG